MKKRRIQAEFATNSMLESGFKIEFIAFLTLIFIIPWPLGLNRDWAWASWASMCFVLSSVLIFRLTHKHLDELLNWFGRHRWVLLACLSWLGFDFFACVVADNRAIVSNSTSLIWPVDPDAALRALFRDTSYVCAIFITLWFSQDYSRTKKIAYTIFFTGVIQAAYGVFASLAEMNTGLGGYAFINEGIAQGSFVNRNHFAGFLELSTGLGIGLMVASLNSNKNTEHTLKSWLHAILSFRVIVRAAIILLVIGLVLTRSRSGNVYFFLAMSLGFILAWFSLRPRPPMLIWLLASLILVDVVVIGGLFGVKEVAQRLSTTDISADASSAGADAERVYLSQATLNVWRQHKFLGVGPGGFRSSFPSQKPAKIKLFYDHAHNDWAQTLMERGLLGAIPIFSLVLGGIFCAIRTAVFRQRSFSKGLAIGCFIALFSLGLHGFTDFNLQIPANALYFWIITALTFRIGGSQIVQHSR